MQTWLNDLLPAIQSMGIWGYWIIGLLVLGEGFALTSLFSPGTVIVLLAGGLVAQGIYDFGDMVWFVAIGTILGAQASFLLGVKGKSLFREGRPLFSEARLKRGERFFASYGAASIVLGHFFGPLRPVVPVAAGLAGMGGWRFFLWNSLGGMVYAAGMLAIGYFFGTAITLVSATLTRVGLFVLVLVVVFALLWFLASKAHKAWPFTRSILHSVGSAIAENSDARALTARHPRLFRFLARRTSPVAFSGLATTFLAAMLLYFLFLYGGLALDIVNKAQITEADLRISSLLVSFRSPALVAFFTAVTAMGAWQVVAVMVLAASALLLLRARPHYLAGLWLTVIGNQITVTLLKLAFARPRPEMAVYVETSYSFPSGHSAIAVALYGYLTYILIRERRGNPVAVFLAGATMVFMIGLSRLYLAEHYLSDVLNGYLVGAIWALVGIWSAEALKAGVIRHRTAASAPPARRLASFGVLASALLATGFLVASYDKELNRPPVAPMEALTTPLEIAFADGLLPPYSENILGLKQQPVSVVILAKNDAALLRVFAAASWHRADPPTLKNLTLAAQAAWFGGEYPTAPITPAFWNSLPHDFGFQAATAEDTLRQRHHARFWKSGFRTIDGLNIYVGTASFDDRLKWGLTHHIDPNVDAERDFLIETLQKTGQVFSRHRFQLVPPNLGENMTGDPFFTDGVTEVVTLAD